MTTRRTRNSLNTAPSHPPDTEPDSIHPVVEPVTCSSSVTPAVPVSNPPPANIPHSNPGPATFTPEFIAAVAAAVKSALDSSSTTPPSGPPASYAAAIHHAGTPPLEAQASSLLAAGVGFTGQPSSSLGRSSLVVPSFITTFATPSPVATAATGFGNFTATVPSAITESPVIGGALSLPPPARPLPSFGQPFIVGPGFSPIPAKLVAQIVAGKFVVLADLSSANLQQTEPEPQLLFDGKLVLTPAPNANVGKWRISSLGLRRSPSTPWS